MRRSPFPKAHWTTWAMVGLLAALLVESGVAVVIANHPVIGVSVSVSTFPSGGLDARFTLSSGISPVVVHAGLVPGSQGFGTDPTVLVFADPQFHPLYSGIGDVFGIGIRVESYLNWLRSGDQVQLVSADQLPSALQDHPRAYLVMVGTGIIPDSVLSNNSSLLPHWIAQGGVLIWGGGPLGYSEAHVDPAGALAYHDSLQWAGQERLVGFPLTDPQPTGPAVRFPSHSGGVPLPLVGVKTTVASALGVTYTATPSGANISRLLTHGGVSLGYSAPGVNGSDPRTSLAWVPVGNGGVFFFGGAVFSPPIGYIPYASVELSDDIALLVSLGYRPAIGPSASANVTLSALSRTTVELSVPDRSMGILGLVRSEIDGGLIFSWDQSLA